MADYFRDQGKMSKAKFASLLASYYQLLDLPKGFTSGKMETVFDSINNTNGLLQPLDKRNGNSVQETLISSFDAIFDKFADRFGRQSEHAAGQAAVVVTPECTGTKLKELKEWFDNGLVTAEEYQDNKAKLLQKFTG